MKSIKVLVEHINDELDGAKDYAEKFVEYKASNDVNMSNKYKEMANDELRHALIIHDEVVSMINRYRNVYTPPQEMLDNWEREHKLYIEKSNWIKLMLQS